MPSPEPDTTTVPDDPTPVDPAPEPTAEPTPAEPPVMVDTVDPLVGPDNPPDSHERSDPRAESLDAFKDTPGATDPPVKTEIPDGSAYVTPDGYVGVVGAYRDPARPLASADINALFAFSGEVRKESTYR